ncbi:MAG: hypothetical protein WCC04_00565 [Terriglobales bacterium]
MLRISIRGSCSIVEIAALLLAACLAMFGQSTIAQSVPVQSLSGPPSGQSLGEIARENQEKKAAGSSTTTPPKVITNADLPKNAGGDADPVNQNQNPAAKPPNSAASRKAAQQRVAEQRAAEQWKKNILAQESVVANLQGRVDRLRARIHFADPGNPYSSGIGYYGGLAYNAQEAREMERLHEMEDQLNQQKKKLEQMQEAARHAGMHTTVYDP